jgi:hypothetical protein
MIKKELSSVNPHFYQKYDLKRPGKYLARRLRAVESVISTIRLIALKSYRLLPSSSPIPIVTCKLFFPPLSPHPSPPPHSATDNCHKFARPDANWQL